MKKQVLKLVALAMLVGALSSCTVEYRAHHRHWDNDNYYRR